MAAWQDCRSSLRTTKRLPQVVSAFRSNRPTEDENRIAKVTLSTGDLNVPYDIVDVVFAYGSSGRVH